MKRITLAVSILVLALLACGVPVVTPTAPTSNVTQDAVILPAANVGGLESVTDNAYVETCTIVAVTETNIRECGNVSCAVVGTIGAGETVTGVCGKEWMTLGRNQFACIAALVGTGGCDD